MIKNVYQYIFVSFESAYIITNQKTNLFILHIMHATVHARICLVIVTYTCFLRHNNTFASLYINGVRIGVVL